MELSEAQVEQFDIDSALAKAISVLNNASALWIDASLDDRLRLQEVLFPQGLVWDGAGFQTPVTCLSFYHLTPIESEEPGIDAIEGVQTPVISFASNELRDESEAGVNVGTLEGGFTGHPHFDPVTGEHHALVYEPFQPVRYISVDRDGRATTKARIDLPHIPLIHDMAFTQSFIIVPDFPVTFQPDLSHTNFPWLWDERRDSRIGLLPRNGDVSRIQWFEAPRCFAFHFANAYDEGDFTIIDLAKHPRMFFMDQNGPNEAAPILVRWTLHRPSGKLTETIVDDRGDEFMRINGRYSGQAYRYVYSAHWGNDVTFGPAMKHDMHRQTTQVHDYGRGRMTSEPVFVRKPGATVEDEGWIMSYVYDPERDLSDVVVLDAQDFTGEPIATIRLPVRVPHGFHGGWAPDRIIGIE